MEAQNRTLQKRRGYGRKKQPGHTANIAFTKSGSIQIIPSLKKRLKTITEPIIGLQYVWEYRSPTKAVPPHYQCKLCKVATLQNEMAAHIMGWKHNFRYIKHSHADKMPYEEEEAAQDPAIRSAIKVSAAEVEKTEGRGQIRVVIKEPYEVMAFEKMKSAQPSMSVPGLGAMLPRPRLPGMPLGRDFPEPLFPEFLLRGGMRSDGMSGPGRFSGPDSMQHYPDGRSMGMSQDDFEMRSRNEDIGRLFSDELPMSSNSRMMGRKDSETNSTLSTLLAYLETFRIECEDDAQIVLKITQKLTDVLMEYRLKSISSENDMNSSPSNSLGNVNYPSRLPMNYPSHLSMNASDWPSNRFSSERFSDNFFTDRLNTDRFSSNMPGSSRFFN